MDSDSSGYDEETTDEEEIIFSPKDRQHSPNNSLIQPLLADSDCSSKTASSKDLIFSTLFERNTKLAKFCVMVVVIFERAAYYSLLGNLVFFLNVILDYEPGKTTVLALSFLGLTWLTCVLGAVLGDVFLGRFKTIFCGFICYVIGFAALSSLAKYHTTENIHGYNKTIISWLCSAVFIISIGEGCFKCNISSFGADQVPVNHDDEVRTFFNYLYWSINIGAFIGMAPLTLLQQELDFFYGYLTPGVLLLLGLIVFLIPSRNNYHIVAPREKLLKKLIKVIANAIRRKRANGNDHYNTFPPPKHWLDCAKVRHGGKFSDRDVDDLKQFFRAFPVLMFLIVYCILYSQMYGTFLIQGLHMKLITFSDDVSVPACWFSMFNIIIVLLFVPVVNRFVYPVLDKLSPWSPYIWRMSIGMILASFSVSAAGVVEFFRQKDYKFGVITNHVNGNITINGTNLTIWYQFPQYGLMGFSEIFVLIAGLEFAYCEAPKSMRSLVTSLFFIANGIGTFLGSIIILIGDVFNLRILPGENQPSKYQVPQLGKNHLSCFFFFLAGLNFLNWIAFLIYSLRKSKCRRRNANAVSTLIQNSLEESLAKRDFEKTNDARRNHEEVEKVRESAAFRPEA